jgi:TolB-like protein
MAVQSERRLAAIMFTDIVGYTALSQADEARSLLVLEEHRVLLRSVFPRHSGKEVKTIGDAFLVEFPSALDAVRCSTDIQQAMHDRNAGLPQERRIQIRVGVHVGDVVHTEGDILGDAVNISSRIEPLAPPGGVCISAQVYDQVRNKIGLPLERQEGKTLKNVSIPVEVYRIIMPWEMETKREEAELDGRRVAVLPLKNMSPDPNDEYFAEGMTEELITSLATVTELTVIARTSTMQYKNSTKRIGEIGRELNAGTLIEGSVRKAGNKVRITVQLIDARNEGHLWSQNYDKELNDVFAIQSEVAQKVAEALKVRMRDSGLKRIEKGATRNPEAHTLYLKGMFHWNKRNPEALRKAAELFAQAVGLDENFALGYAGMAQCYQVMAANFYDDPAVYYPKAIENVKKALSLDDDLAEAHTVIASVSSAYERDLVKGEAEFRRAIELNPSYPTAHQWYSHLLGFELRHAEAMAEIRKAVELSPLSLIINTNLMDGLYYGREFDKAIEQGKKVIDMDPGFSTVYPSLIQVYLRKSMFAEALGAADVYSTLAAPTDSKLAYAYVRAYMGKTKECHKLLSEVEPSYGMKTFSPFVIAQIHFLLKENDAAFDWLEKAYTAHDRAIYAVAMDYELDDVRSDPRYLSILDRIGLAQHLRPG